MAASNFSRLKVDRPTLILLVFICFMSSVTAELRKEVHEYGDCKGSYQKPVGVQDGRIPNNAMTASSSNSKRPPWQARVGRSASAWSPSIQNAVQWLQIDLGDYMTVTAVYTQGRQGSDEYVREYFIEYSDDALTWRRYTNQLGIPLMFEGNKNDSALQIRTLTYPIVAKYIRFNPQRWNMVISMRVEIVGCPFVPETASFDGKSFIEFDMSRQSVQTTQDLIELRFKTGRPDGIIMYASGNQGDIIMLEMRRGYLYVKIDLGSTAEEKGLTEVKAGSLLDDNQWHDVVIRRDRNEMRIVVDRLLNEVTTKGLFYRLDLDKKMFIGGVPYFNQEGIAIKYNFVGCVQNVNLNGAKLIRDALSGTVPTISLINNVNRFCNVKSKVPVTFPTLESFIMITSTTGNVVNVDFEFRTYDTDGLLFYHKMSTDAFVKVVIDREGHVRYTVQTEENEVIEDVVRNTDVLSSVDSFTDGLWHGFFFYMDGDKINCTVDRNSKVSQRKLKLTEQSTFYIGGHELYNGFRGCMRSLYVAQRIVDLNQISGKAVVSATIGTCGIRDRYECQP
ncbi:contactin-associated protein like 5-4 [Elysia marginata]|uniref:Contactin-associated protein like 5-4 n=1 Tax=Elysia marginata TaxID=1093978 RepID=A0AAV4IMS9_9GAST|nr:contactin-associated protein like 5-4 [Elysia marginata]